MYMHITVYIYIYIYTYLYKYIHVCDIERQTMPPDAFKLSWPVSREVDSETKLEFTRTHYVMLFVAA